MTNIGTPDAGFCLTWAHKRCTLPVHEETPHPLHVPPVRAPLARPPRPAPLRSMQVPLLESPAHPKGEAMSPFTGCTTAAEIEAQLAALNRLWWLTRRTA